MSVKTLKLERVSQDRLHPEQLPSNPSTKPLSTIDSSVLRFSATGAVWIYNPPTQSTYSVSQLLSSLRKTLTYYPQWCGQLEWTPFKPSAGHVHRARRIQISWGSPKDPGVEVVVARTHIEISSILPDSEERAKESWYPEEFPSHELFPDTALAFSDISTYKDLPGVIVQITKFRCGALAVAVKMAHVLGDAQTLNTFMKDWSIMNRSLISDSQPPIPSGLFDPSLLDTRASGNIDVAEPNQTLLTTANTVSRARYDYWAPTTTAPAWAQNAMEIPPELASHSTALAPPGVPPPWETWDAGAPAKKVVLHFTAREIRAMHAAATSSTPHAQISQHTALVAHVWLSLLHARASTEKGTTPRESHEKEKKKKPDLSHLTLSLSLRSRISPPLPPHFIGSPIVHAAASLPFVQQSPTSSDASPSLQNAATALTAALATFDTERVGALLHEAAFVDSPQRYWDAFLGERSLIVTSWVRAGCWDVDFGIGGGLRYVEPVMPVLDGIVVLLEGWREGEGEGGKGHWTANGVDVLVSARAEVVEQLVEGGMMRMFR